ncbi:MAG: thioredoxin family protein [Prolixibacteraceae bacterium]|jgi:thioredoxin-like negative regulator of GroEL|nr:thioredoxin family protein [Prolixibacteraceae bacterium]
MGGKTYREITGTSDWEALLQKEEALLVYFSVTGCPVCKTLKPKVVALISNYFPKMGIAFVEMDQMPVLAAQNRIFAAPSVIVFFAGKEYIRKGRGFSVEELKTEIKRIYLRMFPETL